MSLVSMLKPYGASGFGYGSTAEDVVANLDLAGTTILLTGCNSGIGYESMRVLAARGATVLGAARTLDKARAATSSVTGQVIPLECELSEPGSVRACVREVRERTESLDVILCNAGIMALPTLTVKHGLELQFLTNHMGHFQLVTGLLDTLAEHGRVVMLSSGAHAAAPKVGIDFDNLDGAKHYAAWEAYGRSKLANLLFAKQLSRRFEGSTRVANAVHPGVIHTNLHRHMNPLVDVAYALGKLVALKTVPEGAATQVWAAVHPDGRRISGQYLVDCNVAEPGKLALDTALAEKLWKVSEEIAQRLGAAE